MAEHSDLRALRDRPFDLLKELERRSRESGASRSAAAAGDQVGIAVRVGEQLLLLPREDVREVAEKPATTRVPGARRWIRGITHVRGQLLPVIDAGDFLLGEGSGTGRKARMIVANHPSIPAGLLVDEVMGFRRFASEEFGAVPPECPEGFREFLHGAYRRGAETWPVLSLTRLLESSRFADAAA